MGLNLQDYWFIVSMRRHLTKQEYIKCRVKTMEASQNCISLLCLLGIWNKEDLYYSWIDNGGPLLTMSWSDEVGIGQ